MHLRRAWAAWACLLSLSASFARAGDDFTLQFEPATVPGTYTVRVDAVLDAPPAAVRHALLHFCEYKETTAYMRQCVVFNVQGNEAWSYVLLDPPVLDPRDYINRRTIVQDLQPDGTGVMHLRYRQDHAAGPPPRDGVVRVQVNEGRWELAPRDHGTRTAIVYTLTLNPGGVVPLWMARLVARRAAPESVRRVEAKARDLARSGGVELPNPGAPWATVRVRPIPGAAITTRGD
ncbi:MAG: hypothetical protein HY904_11200 [Deltaproteobacteria bacterium]|nr:hypothetical protein [Deltaproteobacteria bacterium]